MHIVKKGRFDDTWHGDGWHVSTHRWTIAIRWRWHLYFVRPYARPGTSRLYLGPFEFERRAPVFRTAKCIGK